MRFYDQQHEFYCDVDRPSNRCLVHHARLAAGVLPGQRETLAQSTTVLIPRLPAPTPLRQHSVVDPPQTRAGQRTKKVEKQNNTGNYRCALLTSEAI